MIKEIQEAFGIVTVFKENNEYKFLLLLQDSKFFNWSFPKGKKEPKEEPMGTALRELKEETGIEDIYILDFPMIVEEYEIQKENKIKHRINKYFLGIVKDKSVTIQENEIFEFKWATFEEAINTFGFQKENRIKVLEKAKEYLEEYERKK